MRQFEVVRAQDEIPLQVVELNAQIRECRRCEQGGFIPEARPVAMDGGRPGGMVLIGQAPGLVEFETRRPFGGRAGRELFRWLARVGIDEDDFRDRVYMAAVTRCFPGRDPSGGGDRRPSRAEIELCRPWLEAVIDRLRPQSLLLVGTLAIQMYLDRRPLTELIGQRFAEGMRVLIPLPHPSGASRWLNDPFNRLLLQQALQHVLELWKQQLPAGENEVRDRQV